MIEWLEGDTLVYRVTNGAAVAHHGLRPSAATSLSGRCAREVRSLRCDDAATDDRVDAAACRRIGVGSMLVAPIVYDGVAAGVVKVFSARAGAFTDRDVATLDTYAALIGAAYADPRRLSVDGALEERRAQEAVARSRRELRVTTGTETTAVAAPPVVRPVAVPVTDTPARVLIVDDDALVGRALVRALRQHHVEWVGDARHALDRIAGGERWDVILCDLMMPGLDGPGFYDAVRAIDEAQADAMVFATGAAFTPEAKEFLGRTPNHALHKPIDMAVLRTLLSARSPHAAK